MSLNKVDPQIFQLITQETQRQQDTLTLIPSENYTSKGVQQALASPFANKYAEGYPGKRYYQGQQNSDPLETLAINRAKDLFQVPHANVQALSGSPANAAVYFAILNPGDTIMGLSLSEGGHLTHGHPKITFSGKYFNSIQYTVNQEGYIDYNELEKLARKHQPKIIIAGITAYSRILDFEKFAYIAASVNAYLLADISHISGLVVTGQHPSPAPHAHVITTTTHKTLRGPRGALVMATQKGLDKDPDLTKKIDRAVFPGLQGGPHLHTIAAIAVGLHEAAQPKFKNYARQIIKNAQALAQALIQNGFTLTTNGTDNHLMVVDLRPLSLPGKKAAVMLEKVGLIVNYNTIPHDPNPPFNPSGLRLGTPAVTSRGMHEPQMQTIARLITDTLHQSRPQKEIHKDVFTLCSNFPIPSQY